MEDCQNPLLQDLNRRQLIQQMTASETLDQHLTGKSQTLYCGFDPTADSLHIGSLVPLLALRRFQLAGHKPIALVGGATGLIGDPSFKDNERNLNSKEIVEKWVSCLRNQVSRFIDFDCGDNSAQVVNNLDWIGQMDVLSFLREVGKYFSVNSMIKKESVKQRIERDEMGISYTEFTYMLLQSYDFAELNKRYNCTLQLGGSDQWGNITGGTELTRRMNAQQVFGLTLPLVTRADGKKFGKTEQGTIWLDAKKTSAYSFYQFWLNTQDADVYRFLRYFTFLDLSHLDALQQTQLKPREAQELLAEQVTLLVHGEQGLASAKRITQALFSNELDALSEQDIQQLRLDGMPATCVTQTELAGQSMTQLFVKAKLSPSGKQIKDALQRQAVTINGVAQTLNNNMELAQAFAIEQGFYGRFFIVRVGKKQYHLFEVQF